MSSESFIPGNHSGIHPSGEAGSATDPTISSQNAGNPMATTNSVNSKITTSGKTVLSDDPTTREDAKPKDKVVGDIKGAVHGSVGSMQAAAGATFRNKNMEQAGLEKMSEEDQRLASKRGVPPVGSGQRNTTTDGAPQS